MSTKSVAVRLLMIMHFAVCSVSRSVIWR